MAVKLFLLFTLTPLVELALLIEIGSRIGLGATLAIVILTGLLGAGLARSQGFAILQRIQRDISQGQLPAQAQALVQSLDQAGAGYCAPMGARLWDIEFGGQQRCAHRECASLAYNLT